MSPNHPHPGPERRRFLRLLALAGLSSVVGAAMAQTPGGSRPTSPAGAAQPAAAPPVDTAAAPPPSAETVALAGIVRQRYGDHLDAAQFAKVTEELEQRVQSGRRLRAVKLGNHEEPDFTFRA
jgi:hypothetical protein